MPDVVATSADPLRCDLEPRALRHRFAGSFRPRPRIYWCDMLASAAVGWAAFAVAGQAQIGTPIHILGTGLAAFALLRAALFIHELAHLKPNSLPGFETAWHLAVGLPLMLPSLTYVGSHGDHHRRARFGTDLDPEYAPIAHWSRLRIARFVLGVALVPLILPVRWGIVGPLSQLVPPLRRLAVERASTLVINPNYRRPMPRGRTAVRWRVQETAAAALFWLVMAGVYVGWIPLLWLGQWWIVTALVLVMNQVRTLAAHGYENEGQPMDSIGQLQDSINLNGAPLVTSLIAPVGLRYHALHHFLPTVPYHSLGTIHRTLLAELPRESPYRSTARDGIVPALRQLWHKASSRSENREVLI